jgi:peroxiredoxin
VPLLQSGAAQLHQRRLTDFAAQGATLVAVSPETPDDTLDTAEKNGLAFPVLSDLGGRLADALGIRFRLSPEIEALYRRFGHDLPARNGDGEWSLPMPATFVVAKGGTIAAAFVDPDYRVRLDPAEALAVLGRL